MLVRLAVAAGALVAILSPEAATAAGAQPGHRLFALSRAGLPYCPTREVQAHGGVWISLACRGMGSARVRIIKRPVHGRLGRLSQRHDRVRYRPRAGFRGRTAS